MTRMNADTIRQRAAAAKTLKQAQERTLLDEQLASLSGVINDIDIHKVADYMGGAGERMPIETVYVNLNMRALKAGHEISPNKMEIADSEPVRRGLRNAVDMSIHGPSQPDALAMRANAIGLTVTPVFLLLEPSQNEHGTGHKTVYALAVSGSRARDFSLVTKVADHAIIQVKDCVKEEPKPIPPSSFVSRLKNIFSRAPIQK